MGKSYYICENATSTAKTTQQREFIEVSFYHLNTYITRMKNFVLYLCLALLMGITHHAHAEDKPKVQSDTTLLGSQTDSTGNEYEILEVRTRLNYVHPDTLPDSVTASLDDITRYITAHYKTEKGRLWAAYSWVCTNVKYNESGLDTQMRYQGSALADYTFKKKIGVCKNYAELYHQLAKRMGIESYLVNGYSIHQEASDNPRHAWVICILDGQPYAFDPTWGAGYYDKKKKKFTFEFKRKWFAKELDDGEYLSTHYPITSYFQCTSAPSTYGDIFYDNTDMWEEGDYVWQDTLRYYTQKANPLEKAEFGLRDMKKNLVIPLKPKIRKPTDYYKKVFKPVRSYRKAFKEDIKYQRALIENLKDLRMADILDKQADSLVQISSKWEYLWNESQNSGHWTELVKEANNIIGRLDKLETNNRMYKSIIKELKYFANCYLVYPTPKGVRIRNHKARSHKTAGKKTQTSRHTIEKDFYKQKERKGHETCALTKITRQKEIEFLFDSYRNGKRRHYTIRLHRMREQF